MEEFDVKFVNNHLDLFFINPDYLKELHEVDSEVYFDNSYYRDNKPGMGLLLNLSEEFRYLIPLSSAKKKAYFFKKCRTRLFFSI